MLAVYASVLDYFLGQKPTWGELERLAGFDVSGNRAVWTVEPLPKMARLGLDIRMIEPFNYPRFLDKGESYLSTLYSEEEIQWYYEHSTIRDMRDYIPEFLQSIAYECRQATLADLDNMLSEDRLVFLSVNSKVLNDGPGFSSHAILILAKEGDEYIAHDPGLPPHPYRRIERKKLWQAMGGDDNTAEMTGFKKATDV